MSSKRLHLISLPHTQVTRDFFTCAYTSKVLKFCKMMSPIYDITLYAPEGPKVQGARLVPCLSNSDRITLFEDDDPARLPKWPDDKQTWLFNMRVVKELKLHSQPNDLVLLTGGRTHKPIADALPDRKHIEPGVGYEGIFTPHCAFESAAWMHYIYAKAGIEDGRYFDEVIPNYFDMDDFPLVNPNPADGKYLMFLGRLIARKGLHVAALIANAAGMPLLVAGPGGKMQDGKLVGDGVTIEGDVKYVGPVGPGDRARLLSSARALLVPTQYIEPFGSVAVEALLCGTPVIASPWGAFREMPTVLTPRTLQEAVDALTVACTLKPEQVRWQAEMRYSLPSVRQKFSRWFDQIETLKGEGWYARS